MLKGARCYSAKCPMERQSKNRPPGTHFWRRRKSTSYGVRLREKYECSGGGSAEPPERSGAVFLLGEAVRLHRSESGEEGDGYGQRPTASMKQRQNDGHSDDRNGPPPPELVACAHVASTRPNRRSRRW